MIELCYAARYANCKPSSMIGDISGYAAYCFDVAASIYMIKLDNGEKPKGSRANEEKDALSFM